MLRGVLREIVVLPIRLYQRIVSPALPRSCKYHPSCSQYAIDAVRAHGIGRGIVLAVWRVLRCNPWSHGGHDPIEHQRLFRSSAKSPPAARPQGPTARDGDSKAVAG